LFLSGRLKNAQHCTKAFVPGSHLCPHSDFQAHNHEAQVLHYDRIGAVQSAGYHDKQKSLALAKTLGRLSVQAY
jgi:hypothetical protein